MKLTILILSTVVLAISLPRVFDCSSKGVGKSNKANKRHSSNVIAIIHTNGTIKGADATGKTVGKTSLKVKKEHQQKKTNNKSTTGKAAKTTTPTARRQRGGGGIMKKGAGAAAATQKYLIQNQKMKKNNNKSNVDGDGNAKLMRIGSNGGVQQVVAVAGKEEKSLELRRHRQYCQQFCGAGKRKNASEGGDVANAKLSSAGAGLAITKKRKRRTKRMPGWCPNCEQHESDEEVDYCARCEDEEDEEVALVADLCLIENADTVEAANRNCGDCETEGGCTHLNGLIQEVGLFQEEEPGFCAWVRDDGNDDEWRCEQDDDPCMASGVDYLEMNCDECISANGCTRITEYRLEHDVALCEWQRDEGDDDDDGQCEPAPLDFPPPDSPPAEEMAISDYNGYSSD